MEQPTNENYFEMNLTSFNWINQPKIFTIGQDILEIQTEPRTVMWQKTHNGYQFDNSPMYITDIKADFTFEIFVEFDFKNTYDQCGIMLYQNSNNWVKQFVEKMPNGKISTGTVATNLGYSDWSCAELESEINLIWLKISRIGQDFLCENSNDRLNYQQMRLFHMHEPIDIARIGVYACSPRQSSFTAKFSQFKFSECLWKK